MNRGQGSSFQGHDATTKLRNDERCDYPERAMIVRNDPVPYFNTEDYQELNRARLSHLGQLISEIGITKGMSVLELGAGVGDHTKVWLDRGLRVTTSDARPANVQQIKARYPSLDVRQLDLDLDPFPKDQFDIVYAYGILYHLGNPTRGLDFISAAARGLALIEICVSGGEDEKVVLVTEPSANPTQAIRGLGCRPTRRWVFNALASRFAYVYQPGTQPAHPQFPLDWATVASESSGLTRAIFVASRQSLDAPSLFPRLLNRQASSWNATRAAGDGLQSIIKALKIRTVLDVGANYGQFARNLRREGFLGRILSFEPLPNAAESLKRNSASDPLWEVHQIALGAQQEVRIFHVSGNSFSSSLLEIERRTEVAEPSACYIEDIRVQVETLDGIWPRLRVQPREGGVMLKMDVQGAELDVLNGSQDALQHISAIVSECSLVPAYKGELLLNGVIDYMRDRGFFPVWLRPGWQNGITGQVYQCDVAFARTQDLPVS